MWSDTLISISMSIGEALFNYGMGVLKEEKNKKLLEKICKKSLEEFADTSLDSDEFYRYVKNESFITALRTSYLFLENNINDDGISGVLCNNIKKNCSKVNEIEVRQFLKKIDEIFILINNKIIMKNEQSFALMSMIIRSNKMLMKKISESEKNFINYLTRSNSIFEFNDEIINTYHRNSEAIFGMMNFTGIVGGEKKNICKLEELYVLNDFYIYSKELPYFELQNSSENSINKINLRDFFKYSNRIVILGGAGFGKSTCLNYIFCNYEKEFNSTALKIKINLKDYANSLVKNKMELLDCLCEEFKKRVSYNMLFSYDIKLTLAKYLDEGKCLVIFDALDEVDSQRSRDKIRDDIANFCNVYFLNRFFITSREVGYLKNKFDDSFLHLKIGLFNEQQIRLYAFKWFRLNTMEDKMKKNILNNRESLNETEINKEDDLINDSESIPLKDILVDKVEKFILEVEKAKCNSLICNPIILVLSLIVFNSEHNLPHKRVEFYKKCIETFLVEREKRKEAFDFKGIESIKGDNLILPKVSYYKFEEENKNKDYKVNEGELKSLILRALNVIDERSWIEPINKFTQYLIERTELISEIDDDKFDFSHKTFSEYFLAIYFTKCEDINNLICRLDRWIGDSNYDELANLIIEVVIQENIEYQHNALLNHLYNEIEKYCSEMHCCNSSIEYRLSREKIVGYISILSKLHSSNSLLPKFIERYHCILMKYPEEIILHKRKLFGNNILRYSNDSNLIISIYEKKYEERSEKNDYFIRLIYYFSETFSNNKDKLLCDVHRKCLEVFKFRERMKLASGVEKENLAKYYLEYFTKEKMLEVNCSGIIFLNLLSLVLINKEMLKEREYIDKLCLYEFERISIFSAIITSEQCYLLFEQSCDGSNIFALTILAIIECNKHDYFRIINFVLTNERKREMSSKKRINYERAIENAGVICDIFRNSKNYEEFVMNIESKKLYDTCYEKIYIRVFESISNDKSRISIKPIM